MYRSKSTEIFIQDPRALNGVIFYKKVSKLYLQNVLPVHVGLLLNTVPLYTE